VTEELEHLLTPTASIVHEEDEDDGKNATPTEAQSETPALVKSEGVTLEESVAQEESFVMPQVPTSIITTPEKDTQFDPLLSQVSDFCPSNSDLHDEHKCRLSDDNPQILDGEVHSIQGHRPASVHVRRETCERRIDRLDWH
jgi:hypothetical protein